MTRLAGLGKGDGRGKVVGVNRLVAHLVHLLDRAHHHNVAHKCRAIKRPNGPGHQRPSGNVYQLLATGVSKASTTAASHDHCTYRTHLLALPLAMHTCERIGKNRRVVDTKVAQALRVLFDVAHQLLQRTVLVHDLLGNAVAHHGDA